MNFDKSLQLSIVIIFLIGLANTTSNAFLLNNKFKTKKKYKNIIEREKGYVNQGNINMLEKIRENIYITKDRILSKLKIYEKLTHLNNNAQFQTDLEKIDSLLESHIENYDSSYFFEELRTLKKRIKTRTIDPNYLWNLYLESYISYAFQANKSTIHCCGPLVIPHYNPSTERYSIYASSCNDYYYRDIGIDGYSIYDKDREYYISEKGIHELDIEYTYFDPKQMKLIKTSDILPIEIK